MKFINSVCLQSARSKIADGAQGQAARRPSGRGQRADIGRRVRYTVVAGRMLRHWPRSGAQQTAASWPTARRAHRHLAAAPCGFCSGHLVRLMALIICTFAVLELSVASYLTCFYRRGTPTASPKFAYHIHAMDAHDAVLGLPVFSALGYVPSAATRWQRAWYS